MYNRTARIFMYLSEQSKYRGERRQGTIEVGLKEIIRAKFTADAGVITIKKEG